MKLYFKRQFALIMLADLINGGQMGRMFYYPEEMFAAYIDHINPYQGED